MRILSSIGIFWFAVLGIKKGRKVFACANQVKTPIGSLACALYVEMRYLWSFNDLNLIFLSFQKRQ